MTDISKTVEEKRGFATGMAVYETYGDDVATVEKPFGKALIKAATDRPEIVGLTADLGKYTDMDVFGHAFPDRYFQIGMAEQNLFGVTAGLARAGLVPFATCYCSFALRRAYDFVAIAIAEAKLNAKVIVALPGVTTGYGATHQGIEDLALARAIPNLVVIDPCDATEIEQAVHAIADYDGPVYMRILRGRVKRVLDPAEHQFEIGRAKLLREGGDVAFISAGLMTGRALEAADELAKDGVNASVLHVSTIKPLDREAILNVARRTNKVVTLENHTLVGGLASAVSEVLLENRWAGRLRKIGIPDVFLECGSVPYLTDKYGLSLRHIISAAKDLAEI
ncbi:MAG: transketolase family protein [Blastocatellia bacterium]